MRTPALWVATFCVSRMAEHPKSLSMQPNCLSRRTTLYVSQPRACPLTQIYACVNCKSSPPLHGQGRQAGMGFRPPLTVFPPPGISPTTSKALPPSPAHKRGICESRAKILSPREGQGRQPQIHVPSKTMRGCDACMARKWKMNLVVCGLESWMGLTRIWASERRAGGPTLMMLSSEKGQD